MNRLNRQLWVLPFSLALTLSLACGPGSVLRYVPGILPTPSTSNVSTGSSPMSGDWNAETKFGRFAFTVDPNGEMVKTAVIKINNFTCGGTTLTTELQVLNPWPISASEFSGSANLESGENLDIYLDGSYDAASKTFAGTWEEDAHRTHCTGDWTTFPHK
jgi:hypothetical protein